jgi:hypothetical protein
VGTGPENEKWRSGCCSINNVGDGPYGGQLPKAPYKMVRTANITEGLTFWQRFTRLCNTSDKGKRVTDFTKVFYSLTKDDLSKFITKFIFSLSKINRGFLDKFQ